MVNLTIRNIVRPHGRETVIAWLEVLPYGHWFKRISQTFALDGRTYPMGSVIVKLAGARYAMAMTADEFTAWMDTLGA